MNRMHAARVAPEQAITPSPSRMLLTGRAQGVAMKAIETTYKGYRFRSRLEARWAVVLDELGMEWEYEKEGYELRTWSDAYTPDGRKFYYLPDFYLPERKIFAEVKGNPTSNDIQHLVSAAIPHWGLPDTRGDTSTLGDRLLILGEMPDEGYAPHGVMLYWWKGDVYHYVWAPGHWQGEPSWDAIGGDNGDFDLAQVEIVCSILRRKDVVRVRDFVDGMAARVGRQARFEHGESGVIRPVLSESIRIEQERLTYLRRKQNRTAVEHDEFVTLLRRLGAS